VIDEQMNVLGWTAIAREPMRRKVYQLRSDTP
jgi:hypothetical protein